MERVFRTVRMVWSPKVACNWKVVRKDKWHDHNLRSTKRFERHVPFLSLAACRWQELLAINHDPPKPQNKTFNYTLSISFLRIEPYRTKSLVFVHWEFDQLGARNLCSVLHLCIRRWTPTFLIIDHSRPLVGRICGFCGGPDLQLNSLNGRNDALIIRLPLLHAEGHFDERRLGTKCASCFRSNSLTGERRTLTCGIDLRLFPSWASVCHAEGVFSGNLSVQT